VTTINLSEFDAGSESSVAIGIFDGVHVGHQRVLAATREAAKERALAPVGLTFDRHPMALLAPERAPAYLCSLSQKVEWMTKPGLVDQAVVARFDEAFAALSPRSFVEQILVQRLRARDVRVGADFRFGQKRAGGVMDLESLGELYGFTVTIVHAVARGGERISSSQIRALVAQGSVDEAAELLGRPFTLRGSVGSGKQLGRTIGFPTANLVADMPGQLLPANGVYAGYALLAPDEPKRRAAISVGTNPTTDAGDPSRKIEAYIMDGYTGDLYGRRIDLEFLGRIREEARFDSVDDLISQMKRDIDGISVSIPMVA
jgi:riboflavin kinase / FMN adenylyltransferase